MLNLKSITFIYWWYYCDLKLYDLILFIFTNYVHNFFIIKLDKSVERNLWLIYLAKWKYEAENRDTKRGLKLFTGSIRCQCALVLKRPANFLVKLWCLIGCVTWGNKAGEIDCWGKRWRSQDSRVLRKILTTSIYKLGTVSL